jgi:hypothetical protein
LPSVRLGVPLARWTPIVGLLGVDYRNSVPAFGSGKIDQSPPLERSPVDGMNPTPKMNTILRTLMAVPALCLAGSAANYYLELGWFGESARLVYTALMFVTSVSLVVAIRNWRNGG